MCFSFKFHIKPIFPLLFRYRSGLNFCHVQIIIIVTDVYDLLVEFSNYVVDAFDIKIDHCLCGVKGAKIEDVKEVYSHPQAFMQSNAFIEEQNVGTFMYSALSPKYSVAAC